MRFNYTEGGWWSGIILYGKFIEPKIATLKDMGTNARLEKTYLVDEKNGDKWLRGFPCSETDKKGEAQLKKVHQFPFE